MLYARALLGARLHDMASGFQGFHRSILGRVVDYPFKPTGHFYQTELRHDRLIEAPIHYRAVAAALGNRAQEFHRRTLALLLAAADFSDAQAVAAGRERSARNRAGGVEHAESALAEPFLS